MRSFENYAEQGLQFGRTVPYEVTELKNPDGTHPLLHVEHLGAVNASLIEEQIARAGSDEKKPERTDVISREHGNRDAVIRHCVRRIERVVFSDGTEATDADIPAFIRALPVIAFARLLAFLTDERNFCKFPIAGKPADLAEK